MNTHTNKYLCCIAIILFIGLSIQQVHAEPITSITPTQRVNDNPYLQIKHLTLNAFTMTGNIVFINSSPPYSIEVPLNRVYDDFGQHQLTTRDYQSNVDGALGYSLNSIVSTFPVSKVRVQFQVHGTSMIVRLKITLIVTTAIFTNYMQFGQKTINSPMSPQFFVNQDVPNTKFIPLVKSFITTFTGDLGTSPQMMGFKTYGSKVFDVNNTMVYQVYFDKTPSAGNFTVSVTYVVIQINEMQYKKTAQFSNLEFTWTYGYTSISSQTILPPNYDPAYVNDLMLSPNQFPSISTQKSFYSIITDSSGITISTNNLNSKAQYSFIDFKDLQCPSSQPYKKKGNTLCYSCPNTAMILVNGNALWTELNSTFTNPICTKLNLTLSMYEFDSLTGRVKTVCGYCRQCTAQYYLQQSGTCKQCNTSMLNCQQCSSGISCQKCVSGFYLQQNGNNNISKCSSCSLSIVGCDQCHNNSTCDKCLTGYFINNLKKCQSCSQNQPNCLQCNDLTGLCTKCQPGYFSDSTGACRLCNQTLPNCIQCTSKTNCTLCQNPSTYQLKYLNPNNPLLSDKYCSYINSTITQKQNLTNALVQQQQSQLKKILPFALGIGLPLIIFASIAFCYIKKLYYSQQQQQSLKINPNELHLVTTQQLTQQIVNIDSPTILSKLQSLIGKLLDRFDTQIVKERLDINLTANY